MQELIVKAYVESVPETDWQKRSPDKYLTLTLNFEDEILGIITHADDSKSERRLCTRFSCIDQYFCFGGLQYTMEWIDCISGDAGAFEFWSMIKVFLFSR